MGLDTRVSISWPGCGVMVFWQLGVLKGLSRFMDTSMVPMLGSSSGALVTAMAACQVSAEDAATELQQLLKCNSVRTRRLGLFGVLGNITRTWLESCLPNDAGALLSRRSTILLTELPLLRTVHITNFASKQDVMDVAMASAHLPLVLDGSWYALCRQRPVIDGGFWWWWHRCDKAYQVPGGASPASLAPAASAAAAVVSSAGPASPAGLAHAMLPATSARSYSSQGAETELRPGLGGLLQLPAAAAAAAAPPPPPLVSYSSPTSFLDFIAADVQRSWAPDVGLGGATTSGVAGAPNSASAFPRQVVRFSSGGNGISPQGSCPAVVLVQPSDDAALAAGWRRYRRWRADDLAVALEMMRHGENYGSGPLRRRLEQLC